MHLLRPRVSILIAALAIAVAGLILAPVHASATPRGVLQWSSTDEERFVSKINELRTSLGLVPLNVDAELTERSRIWSETMRQAGSISHDPNPGTAMSADWKTIGENVGVGGDVDALFEAFVRSPAHYANLINPEWRFVGVGVVMDGDRMFTTHRFMSLRPPPAPTSPGASPAPGRRSPQPAPAPAPAPAPVPAPEPVPASPPNDPASVPPPSPVEPRRLELLLSAIGDDVNG